ncbi:reverse transcriptase [Plakobranchus ocellatus]|uniref:Reverse transcriptase n=1 Tax=Plakobranchus ocellatus TaxID=259542 RepID=A0AAV3YX12_9GAST|nr:reverse transcriptase [Plakobranchus ocellatus]
MILASFVHKKYDGSIGDNSMLTGTAPRTTRTRTPNVGLEMDYTCICNRRFATERGMKIHRTKMGCISMSSQQQRTAVADKTWKTKARFKTTVQRTETPQQRQTSKDQFPTSKFRKAMY